MKRIIDIDEDYFEIIKHDVQNGQDYKPLVLIANSISYEEIEAIDNAPTVSPDMAQGGTLIDIVPMQGLKPVYPERPYGEKKPLFKSVPTYRNYEDYHDAEQYTRGWNDAMRFIFGGEEE